VKAVRVLGNRDFVRFSALFVPLSFENGPGRGKLVINASPMNEHYSSGLGLSSARKKIFRAIENSAGAELGLKRLPDRESLAEVLAHGIVVVAPHAAPENTLDLFDVRQTIRPEDILVGDEAHDLADEDRVRP